MRITQSQVEVACDIASKVYDRELRRKDGIEQLAVEHGINQTSAADLINDYKYLVEGRVFHRAMSAFAMRLFVQHIFDNRPLHARQNSVAALRAHITYYEGHYKTRMHAMREVADFFEKTLGQPETLEEVEGELSRRVASALLEPRSVRLARLQNRNAIPKSRSVSAVVFDRSADVIAEVLVRAKGVCEGCQSYAPFKRAKDGTPYLEVHHKVRLADGGEDTVANATALCPNCHRRSHYGADA